MADIASELNSIKHAIYGGEVRDSIHDAIEKINDEVDENKEEIDSFIQGELDTTLTSTTLPAQGKAVGDAISDVESALINNFQVESALFTTWAKGTLTTANGTASSSSTRIRSAFVNAVSGASVTEGYKFAVYVYDENQTYLGLYDGTEIKKEASWQTSMLNLMSIPSNYFMRFLVAYNNDSSSIAIGDSVNLTVYTTTDSSLTQSGKAADAKTVGTIVKNTAPYMYAIDPSAVSTIMRSVGSDNKWYKIINGSGRASMLAIPKGSISVDITVQASTIISFLNTLPDQIWNISTGDTVDFSASYPGRITFQEVKTIRYYIEPDMHYIVFNAVSTGGENIRPTEITFNMVHAVCYPNVYPYQASDYVRGGISLSDGTGSNVYATNRVRSDYHEILNMAIFSFDPFLYYIVAYYDEQMALVGYTEWTNTPEIIIRKTDFENAKYARVVIRKTDGISDFDRVEYMNYLDLFYFVSNAYGSIPRYAGLIRDVPKNIGVLNMISRAQQCSQISYKTVNVLPNQNGDIAADRDVKGICYSSVRDESLYVPNCVSFDSYMTSILNPNSYIYTRQSEAPNSKTYLGTVCSAFVSYSLGLPCVYTTHQLGELPDLILAEDQSVYGIELGSMLLRTDVHVAICTDIYRDSRGRIKYIQLSEAVPSTVKSRVFTPEQVVANYLSHNYRIYNYQKIYKIDYEPSQWVAVEDEIPQTPVYNHNLFPRRGDKANWRYGENVVIDVINDDTAYTYYKLYKGDSLISSLPIPSGNVIELNTPAIGNYKICLTNNSADSDFAYFAVVDVTITVENQGNKTAKVSFEYSENATPVYVAWCYTSGSDINAAKYCEVISDTDITNGYILTQFASGANKFSVKVKTDYGLYSSDFVTETITN